MATAAVISPSDISFVDAPSVSEQWFSADEPTDDEKLQFLGQAIKDLGEPENVQKFTEAMTDLAVRAVKTDDVFHNIQNTMDTFVKEHGNQFPGIKPFRDEWSGYVTKWREYVTTSRDFAKKTASEYDEYTLYLSQVWNVSTKDDLDKLAADFKDFSTNKPLNIPVDFQNKFLDLRRDVAAFQTRVDKYLVDQGSTLTEKAKNLKDAIAGLEIEIANLDAEIKKRTSALEIAAWWGPVAIAIAGSLLAVSAIQRKNRQGELDQDRTDLEKVEADQTALGEMQAQFAGLVPDFKILSENLGLFADTWNAFHNEALDFATKFEKLTSPTHLPKLLQGKIDLALKVSVPLSQGLRDYASKIHF